MILMTPQKVDLMTLVGLLKPRKRGVTVEAMNVAIRKAACGDQEVSTSP
jgi:hypothetical protein